MPHDKCMAIVQAGHLSGIIERRAYSTRFDITLRISSAYRQVSIFIVYQFLPLASIGRDLITTFLFQEVETDQFYNFFLPELKQDGYDGIFSPKSRAKTMSESERKYVDGCAIFFRSAK